MNVGNIFVTMKRELQKHLVHILNMFSMTSGYILVTIHHFIPKLSDLSVIHFEIFQEFLGMWQIHQFYGYNASIRFIRWEILVAKVTNSFHYNQTSKKFIWKVTQMVWSTASISSSPNIYAFLQKFMNCTFPYLTSNVSCHYTHRVQIWKTKFRYTHLYRCEW